MTKHSQELETIESQYMTVHDSEIKSIKEANEAAMKSKEEEIKKIQGDVEARMVQLLMSCFED